MQYSKRKQKKLRINNIVYNIRRKRFNNNGVPGGLLSLVMNVMASTHNYIASYAQVLRLVRLRDIPNQGTLRSRLTLNT